MNSAKAYKAKEARAQFAYDAVRNPNGLGLDSDCDTDDEPDGLTNGYLCPWWLT